MGVPLANGSLVLKYNGETIALDEFLNVVGANMVDVVLAGPDGWDIVYTIDPMLTMAEVQQVGGIVQYETNTAQAINADIAKIFPMNAPSFVPGPFSAREPTSDADALALVQVWSDSGHFNVPATPIPQALKDAFAAFWSVPVGWSESWAGGSLTKTGNALAEYCDPSGIPVIPLCPASDLNAIAKLSPAIAATWKREFGFTPV